MTTDRANGQIVPASAPLAGVGAAHRFASPMEASAWTADHPWMIARGDLALSPELLDRTADRMRHAFTGKAPPEMADEIRTAAENLLGFTLRTYTCPGSLTNPRRMGAGEVCKEHVDGDARGWRTARYFTAVAMLSDPSDYRGGTLKVRTDRVHWIPLGRGEIVVFRATTPHGVSMVTSGERCTIVGHFEPHPPSPAALALP